MSRIRRKRGDTVKMVVGPVRVGGVLVVLVGGTLRFGAKAAHSDAARLLTKTFGPIAEGDLLAEDPANPGQRVLWTPVAAGDTSALLTAGAARTLFYDVELQTATGEVYTVESGTFTIEPDVAGP